MNHPILPKLAAATAIGAAALSLPSAASGAESFSPILGYYSFDVPAGNSMWVCGLVKAKDHQGGMDNVSFSVSNGETTIIENDRDLTELTLDKHYVEIIDDGGDGTWNGLVLDIKPGSATANSLVVLEDLQSFTGLGTDSVFAIREHNTLGDLFPEGAGFPSDFVDSLTLFYPDLVTPSKTYVVGDLGTGRFWRQPTDIFASADDEVVYPGQGMLFNLQATSEVLIGKNGISHVKDTPTITKVTGGFINLVGLVNPLVVTDPLDPLYPSTVMLDQLALKDELTPFTETIGFFQPGDLLDAGTFTPSNITGPLIWIKADPFTDEGATPVQIGQAFNISVAAGSELFYQQPVLHPTN